MGCSANLARPCDRWLDVKEPHPNCQRSGAGLILGFYCSEMDPEFKTRVAVLLIAAGADRDRSVRGGPVL